MELEDLLQKYGLKSSVYRLGDKAQKSATPQGFGSFDTGMDDGFDLPFQDASDEEIPF